MQRLAKFHQFVCQLIFLTLDFFLIFFFFLCIWMLVEKINFCYLLRHNAYILTFVIVNAVNRTPLYEFTPHKIKYAQLSISCLHTPQKH